MVRGHVHVTCYIAWYIKGYVVVLGAVWDFNWRVYRTYLFIRYCYYRALGKHFKMQLIGLFIYLII